MDEAVGRASTLIRHWREPRAIQMFKQGRGISTVVAVVVAIIIIAAAAGAIYYSSTTSNSTSSTSSHSTSSQSLSSAASSTTKQSSSSTASPVQSSTTQQSGTFASSSTQSSQSTSSTQSSYTFTSNSCSYTSTSTTTQNFAPLFRNFTKMEVSESGTIGGMKIGYNSSYTVEPQSNATIFVVYVNTNASAMGMQIPESGTFWVRTDGTVVTAQVEMMGLTVNSTEAIQDYSSMMAAFATEMTGGADVGFSASASNYFHQTGTPTTASFGPTTMSVTSYAANSLPETISECGSSVTINAISIQIGAVPSSNLRILTYENFEGTIQSEAMDITVSLISLTKA